MVGREGNIMSAYLVECRRDSLKKILTSGHGENIALVQLIFNLQIFYYFDKKQ